MSHGIWARLITLFNQNYETDNKINIVEKLQIELAVVTISNRDRLGIKRKKNTL